MSQHPLYVMILWHMHQPYYKDVSNQEYLMPWVGLHATKDYLDMPMLAGEYPDLRITFNMVPSLLEQIADYAAGTAHDRYLALAMRRPEEMDDLERANLLQMFFAAHYDRMIRPYARYRQLHERRGWSENLKDISNNVKLFSAQDLRDLQVWFYLTWIDPYLRERDPRLLALMQKESQFTEQEKLQLLQITRELAGQIIPTMKDLWERGQIEISTTPYFHPILPLLVDTNIARRPRPKVALPTRRFQHPEDAERQIQLGLDYCKQLFGRQPAGMWPSEGSICPELVPMFQKAGVGWIASDEDGLAQSLGLDHFARDRNGVVDNADALYRPYIATHDGAETAIFFRDHFLSDQIGFKYAHWGPRDAAADLIRRLEEVQHKLRDSSEPHVVSIILDGENCWEHYEGDGQPFLRALYQGLTTNRQLQTVTPSGYLELFKEHRRLERLHSGSWINRDFQIWIGHPEDNASWDLLAQAREEVGNRLQSDGNGRIREVDRQRAMKSIMIAEGSDWNWWYGDENHSAFDAQFDALYRQHLKNAYAALELEAPGRLFFPICSQAIQGLQIQPRAFITPKIDGRITNYFEWFAAGHYDPRLGGDSMHQVHVEYLLESLHFGFDMKHFYLRLDLSRSFWENPARAGMEVVIYLFTQQNFKIACRLDQDQPQLTARIMREDDEHGWVEDGHLAQVCLRSILELAVPCERVQILPDKMLRFQVAIEQDGVELERCPSGAPLSTRVPNENFEELMWIV